MTEPDMTFQDETTAVIEYQHAHVQMVQRAVGAALVAFWQLPEAERVLHIEALMALANVLCGVATDWLTRAPREEFETAKEATLRVIARMAGVIAAFDMGQVH